MDCIEEERRPRRQKISKAKTPAKSKHKHMYMPCILEYNALRLSAENGFLYDKPAARIDGYCPICGKLGPLNDPKRWFANQDIFRCPHEPTEEYFREMDPKTRTLPTFWVEDPWFTKYVPLEQN